jgi:excisionase family DNA binding protein
MEERHLSLSEAADTLNISERTAYRWIKSGKLRAYKPGRDYWIPESAIKKVVEESVVRPKARAARPLEPSFNDALADERRLRYVRAWRAFLGDLFLQWTKEPPATPAEIRPLLSAMKRLVEHGVFDTTGVTDQAELDNISVLTNHLRHLSEIADAVERDDTANQRRELLKAVPEELSA